MASRQSADLRHKHWCRQATQSNTPYLCVEGMYVLSVARAPDPGGAGGVEGAGGRASVPEEASSA